MAERRYDEKELAAILRAAAESQAGSATESDSVGFTLPEIQRLAAEVGIEPSHVETAASKLSAQPEESRKFRWAGAPSRVIHERTFNGLVGDLAWEEIVAEMRAAIGATGTTGTMGTSREWSGGTDFLSAHLSATPRDGRTRVRITLRQESGLVVSWLLGFTLAFLSALPIGVALGKNGYPVLTTILSVLAVTGLVAVLTNRAVARWHRKNRTMAEGLLDRLEPIIAEQPAVRELSSIQPESPVVEQLLNQPVQG